MNAYVLQITLAVTASTVSNYCHAATLQTSPFAAATGGVWTGSGSNIVPEVLRYGPGNAVLVETGLLPGPTGTYRASLGSAGFSTAVAGNIDREVAGGTGWSDGFTVTGGSGVGSLVVSSHIEGILLGQSEMVYALYTSSKPFSLDLILDTIDKAKGFWTVTFPDSVRVQFTGVVGNCNLPKAYRNCGHLPYENYQGSLDLKVVAIVPFTYGQPLYVASFFAGGSQYEGNTNFLNSAKFGITAPPTSTMNALSGFEYAAAVPEPAEWLLLLSGLGFCATFARRYKTSVTTSKQLAQVVPLN